MKRALRIAIPFAPARDERERRKQQYYLNAVRTAGGEPVVLSTLEPARRTREAASQMEGILLPGSPADVDPRRYHARRQPQCASPDPAREQADYSLLEVGYRERKPVLAICYGVQILNVFRGGTLIQHIDGHESGRKHRVHCAAGSLVAKLAGGMAATVNSYHHQAVKRAGRELRVVAEARDGTIEALEGGRPDHFVLGVQWHPERDFDSSAFSQAIFRKFIQAAAEHPGE